MAFQPDKKRDATATIRGYVYQVDTTILRWLNLADGEAIQMECGEDIDRITHALPDCDRVLEQVKHLLNRSVTLHSPAVVATIAHALLHMDRNPGLKLRFLFTSNASIGKEQPPVTSDGDPGLKAWSAIADNALKEKERNYLLRRIQKHLKTATRPTGFNKADWKSFQSQLAGYNLEQMRALVGLIEWRLGGPGAKALEETVIRRIMERGEAPDQQQAVTLYQKLFLHVFKLLSRAGEKRVSLSDLQAQLVGSLTPEDQKTLEDVVLKVLEIARRLAALEATVDQHGKRLDAQQIELVQHGTLIETSRRDIRGIQQILARGIPPEWTKPHALGHAIAVLPDDLAQSVALEAMATAAANGLGLSGARSAQFGLALAMPTTELPPLVGCRSERKESVAKLLEVMQSHVWVALHGPAGCGKTQLLNLAVRTSGQPVLWFRFRDTEQDEAHAMLAVAIAQLGAQSDGKSTTDDPVRAMCAKIGPGAVIVLDDLPSYAAGALADQLCHLAGAAQETGVKLMSTSTHDLPSTVLDKLPGGLHLSAASPPITDTEALEIFEAHGAPRGRFDPKIMEMFNAIAGRHPQLLCALSLYLAGRSWVVDWNVIERIWKGEHARGLSAEVMARVLETMTDSESRDLLYRLNVTIGSFTDEDALALASVPPVLARPQELLHKVTGLWVQQDVRGRFTLSPLVKLLSTTNIPDQTRRSCSEVLGDRILQKGSITSIDGVMAIAHFSAGEAYAKAALVLMLGLISLLNQPKKVDDFGLGAFWMKTPLPAQLSLEQRVHLRSLQVLAGEKMGRDVKFVKNDLISLVNRLDDSQVTGLLAAVPAIPALAQENVQAANKVLLRALQVVASDKLPSELAGGVQPLASLIWLTVKQNKTVVQVLDWLTLVEQMPPKLRQQAFATDIAAAGSRALLERPWLDAHAAGAKDWAPYIKAYGEIALRAQALGLAEFSALAMSMQITICGEEMDDLAAAQAVATEALRTMQDDPCARFLIKECLGRQFFYKRRLEEARRYLREALSEPKSGWSELRVDALTVAGIAFQETEPDAALAYAQDAATLAQQSKTPSSIQRVRTLGELALGLQKQGRLADAFGPFEQAANILVGNRGEPDYWKETIVLFAHVGHFLLSLVQTGRPPPAAGDGGPFALPESGIFLSSNPKLLTLYTPNHRASVAMMMAAFARTLGRTDKLADWAPRSLDLSQKVGQPMMAALFEADVTAAWVEKGLYEKVIPFSYACGKTLMAGRAVSSQIEKDIKRVYDPSMYAESHLGSPDSETWEDVNRFAVLRGIVPCLCHILHGASHVDEERRKHIQALQSVWLALDTGITAPRARKAVSDALQELASGTQRATDVKRGIENASADSWRPELAIHLIGYGLCADLTLPQALAYHAYLLHWLKGTMGTDCLVYQKVVLPWLIGYWHRAFDAQRFRFVSPQLVQEELATIATAPANVGAQRLLSTMSRGLDMKLPDTVRQWIEQAAGG